MMTTFPEKKKDLLDLEFELVARKEEIDYKFARRLFVSWGFLFLYTGLKGPIPILYKTGYLFKTNRIVRQYLYSFAFVYGLTYYPFRESLKKTTEKLRQVEKNLERDSGDYVKPKNPMIYLQKM